MAQMSLREIADSAHTLSNQLFAGIPLSEATEILAEVQPKLHSFWEGTTRSLQRGFPLSQSLKDVWPESLVNVVFAGENAGKTAQVLQRIEKAMLLQIDLQQKLKEIYYPVGILIAGLSVFLLMMVGVVPLVLKSFPQARTGRDKNIFTSMSIWLESFVKDNWLLLLVAIIVLVVGFIYWVRSDAGKQALLEILIDLPYVGIGFKNLFFGVWAEYLAMIFAAGIPLIQGISLTVNTLPVRLRHGVFAFENDLSVKNYSIQRAVDIKHFPENDPRFEWPIYLRRAFLVGSKTGEIDKELITAGPLLVTDGSRKLDLTIKFANKFALMVSGIVVASTFAAVYMPMISALKNVR